MIGCGGEVERKKKAERRGVGFRRVWRSRNLGLEMRESSGGGSASWLAMVSAGEGEEKTEEGSPEENTAAAMGCCEKKKKKHVSHDRSHGHVARPSHRRISPQNVLAACNFDLQFIYVLSGWEGSAHDSKVLNYDISRRNGLKVPSDEFPPEPEDDPVENEEDNFNGMIFKPKSSAQRDNVNQWKMSIANQMWAEAQANANNDNEESDHEGEK
ncbi:hypothetical protein ACLB2K_009897 [Fragaria x ananassa]